MDDYSIYMLFSGAAVGFLVWFFMALFLGVIDFMRRMIG